MAFSADPLNLTNIHSSRFNGCGAQKAVGIPVPPTLKDRVSVKVATSKSNKPKSSVAAYPLKREFKRSTKALKAHTSGYRSDLQGAALARFAKIAVTFKTKAQKARVRVGKRASKK